jgi:leucyl-tRNA synthetase
MEYNFRNIEKKWQDWWKANKVYTVNNVSDKPKYYVLDMFPYPSGAGLHVGHPLGYIASDIYSRYKRLKGFNVLHPMGFDSFGLPAEQYALETGQHPAETTKKNIATFKSQLDKIGFCYDWEREVQTSDPKFYKWTQWIFLQLFNSFYNRQTLKAESITQLVALFEKYGSDAPGILHSAFSFTSDEWKAFDENKKMEVLMEHRLAFSKYGEVNWCEALGTVLANDEVVNGVSERGGHPVEKKKMRQWYLRITAYAERLLEGLEKVDFSDSMKEMQRNWIGKSSGAEMDFEIRSQKSEVGSLRVYTTRPDTIFGVDFMVLAPEHELVAEITTAERKEEIEKYLLYVKSRSDRERQAEVKQITGCFAGSYAINPFDGRAIPIWISEYVLAGYGTGAIMAVPCGDDRDFAFAKHFNIPITNIIGDHFNSEEANATKEAVLQNSGFLNGMLMKDAIDVAINRIEELGIGKRKVNYKMRDAGFSRQRYWGEPFPIIWSDGIAIPLDEKELPLELPHVDKYGPGPNGEGPLANLTEWANSPLLGRGVGGEVKRETSTMPGYAGSSWYFLRYMDPHNDETFCDRKISDYWNQVDLYIGGTEHAVGHLLYSRMWTKFLYDLGLIGFDEPYKRLVNQGMIQGSSRFVYRMNSGYKLLANILETYFKEYRFIEEHLPNRDWNFDFTSHIKKINIQILYQEDIEDGLAHTSKYFSSDYNYIFIAHEEMFEYYSQGLDKFVSRIRELLTFNTNYHSVGFPVVNYFISFNKLKNLEPNVEGTQYRPLHVDVKYVNGFELDREAFKKSRSEYVNAQFVLEEDGKYICGAEVEKMSKRYFNTVNPDDLCEKYGADTFRMYEMFLGPVEASKPWDTKGIEGVHRFLKKLWRLFFKDPSPSERGGGEVIWNEEAATDAELKILHRTIKRIEEDTERFSFNTAVSTFMICVNELADVKCHKKEILEPLLILLAPYAPHIAEELWSQLGNQGLVLDAVYPAFHGKYLVESSKEYPISINGKLRTTLSLALDLEQKQVEEIILQNEIVKKWLEGKAPKKIIYVKNKMINVVV